MPCTSNAYSCPLPNLFLCRGYTYHYLQTEKVHACTEHVRVWSTIKKCCPVQGPGSIFSSGPGGYSREAGLAPGSSAR